MRYQHTQGKTAHQLGSCLGGGSAADGYQHFQVTCEIVIFMVKIVKKDDDDDHE